MTTTRDPFRSHPRALSSGDLQRIEYIKYRAEKLLNAIEDIMPAHSARELALARTKLEETVMWAVKGLTG